MTHRVLAVLAALGIALVAQAGPRQRYSVTTKGSPRAAMQRVAGNSDDVIAQRVHALKNVDGFVAELTAEEAEELRQTPGVEAVERTVERRASASNLETYNKQLTPWGIPVVRAAT